MSKRLPANLLKTPFWRVHRGGLQESLLGGGTYSSKSCRGPWAPWGAVAYLIGTTTADALGIKTPSTTLELMSQSRLVRDSFGISPTRAQAGFAQLVKEVDLMLHLIALMSSRITKLEEQIEMLIKRKSSKRKRIQQGGTIGASAPQRSKKARLVMVTRTRSQAYDAIGTVEGPGTIPECAERIQKSLLNPTQARHTPALYSIAINPTFFRIGKLCQAVLTRRVVWPARWCFLALCYPSLNWGLRWSYFVQSGREPGTP